MILPETMEVEQHFSSAKRKKPHQSRILDSVKISFRNKEKLKHSLMKENQEYIASRPTLKEWLQKTLETG